MLARYLSQYKWRDIFQHLKHKIERFFIGWYEQNGLYNTGIIFITWGKYQ